MAKVRPLERKDIPQVVTLRRKCFSESYHNSDESLAAYMEHVFFESPWSKGETESVVCEAKDGNIIGFHGRFRKRMLFGGAECQLITGAQLMADPGASGFPGFQILQKLFRGDHDLFIADGGNDDSRRMWEALNGNVLHIQSLNWLLPIRKRYQLRHLGTGRSARLVRLLTQRALAIYDLAKPTIKHDIEQNTDENETYSTQTATPESMAEALRKNAAKKVVLPTYQPDELRWVLDHIEQENEGEVNVNRVIKGRDKKVLGWFSYQPRPGHTGRVLGIMCRDGAYGAVLDALVADASERGCDSLQGRVEPCYLNELGKLGCEFKRSGPWFLVHSKRPEILSAICRGDSKLTLLDGERWLHF